MMDSDHPERDHSNPNRSKSAGSKINDVQCITYRVNRNHRKRLVRPHIEYVFPDQTRYHEPHGTGDEDIGAVQVEMEPEIQGESWISRRLINFTSPNGLVVPFGQRAEQHILLYMPGYQPRHLMPPQGQHPPAQQPQFQGFPAHPLPAHPLPVQLPYGQPPYGQPPLNYPPTGYSIPGYPFEDYPLAGQYPLSHPLPAQSIPPQNQQQFPALAPCPQQHSANSQQPFQEGASLETPVQPQAVPITPDSLYHGHNSDEEQVARAGYQQGEGPPFPPQGQQFAYQQGGDGLYYAPPPQQVAFQYGNGGLVSAPALGPSPEAWNVMQNQQHDVLDVSHAQNSIGTEGFLLFPGGELSPLGVSTQ